jgi:hypothetical protein
MHTHSLDFGTILRDRLRPSDQPIAQQRIHTRSYSEAGREGPIVLVQLHGGLRSPNMTVTSTGTTTIHMAEGATCIDNTSDTSSTALFRIFRLIKTVNLKGSSNSGHIGSHYTRLILKPGTVYTTRQTPILLYGM